MQKQNAINILEDIQQSLNNNDIEKAKKDIELYQKNIKVTISPKIKKLIIKHKDYIKKYGENGKKTIALNKKIDKELNNIFNK